MKDELLQLFQQYREFAVLISLLISIIIAVSGVLPSFFITAANILFFGFEYGLLISFLGEAIGAIVAFILYRRGFKKGVEHKLQRYPSINKLLHADNREAFMLVLSLRLIPFVPSGLVTFAAAVGRMSAAVFFVSSSLGKIPALLMEGYSVYQVTRFGWQGKLILAIIALTLIYFTVRHILRRKK